MYAYPTISIPKLHTEYTAWMEELTFFKEEIRKFEHYLETMVCQCDCKEKKAQIEHFQNVFIRQKEVIDIMKHNLHVSEKQLTSFVKKMSGMGLSSIKMDNHSRLREEMQTFRKLYQEMKDEFRRFECLCKQ